MAAKLNEMIVGVGEQSLIDWLTGQAYQGARVYFSNVSDNDTFNDCKQRFYWDSVHGGTGVQVSGAEPHHALKVGTAIHLAAEHLMVFRDKTPAECADVAREHILEVYGDRDGLGERNWEALDAFDHYIGDLVEAGAPVVRLEAEGVLFCEQLVWAAVPYEEALTSRRVWIVIMGRPDAVIMNGGQVWHLQHKSRGREGEYDSYSTKLSFGGHETVYGAILQKLVWDPKFQADYGLDESVTYGGSKLAIWLKQQKPNSTPIEPPKGLLEARAKGHVDFDGFEIEREGCTDKQWEKAQQLYDNWINREAKRLEAIRSYSQRAVQIVDVDLDEDKICLGLERVVNSVYEQESVRDLTADGLAPYLQMPVNTNACERFGSTCPFLESKTCGGWEEYDVMDTDSAFEAKPVNYVAQMRRDYDDMVGYAQQELEEGRV